MSGFGVNGLGMNGGRWVSSTRVAVLSVLLVAGGVVGVAFGQPGKSTSPPKPPVRSTPNQPPARPPGNAPAQTPAQTPAQPPAGTPANPADAKADDEVKRPEPTAGPWTKTERSREWILQVTLGVRSNTNTQRDGDGIPIVTPFKFQTMGVMWPIVTKTAGSDADTGGIAGELILEGRSVTQSFKLLGGYPGGAVLARFDASAEMDTSSAVKKRLSMDSRDVVLNVTVPTTCRRVLFDEPTAIKVGWPKTGWPKDVASALAPQMWVEMGPDESGQVKPYDTEPLREAVKKWLGNARIADPQASTPVAVAKAITAGVWTSVQVSGDGLISADTGEFAGMTVQAPVVTLRAGRGTSQDVVAVLAASLKLVGLPVRTVIGWDVSGKTGNFLKNQRRENKFRVWIEFPIYNDVTNELSWIPVDLDRLRKVSSRPGKLDTPWKYFGTHDELDYVVPVALQFSPPTDTAFYGAPAFWGWFVTPSTPKEADQRVLIRAAAGSKTSDSATPGKTQPPEEKDRKGKGHR